MGRRRRLRELQRQRPRADGDDMDVVGAEARRVVGAADLAADPDAGPDRRARLRRPAGGSRDRRVRSSTTIRRPVESRRSADVVTRPSTVTSPLPRRIASAIVRTPGAFDAVGRGDPPVGAGPLGAGVGVGARARRVRSAASRGQTRYPSRAPLRVARWPATPDDLVLGTDHDRRRPSIRSTRRRRSGSVRPCRGRRR